MTNQFVSTLTETLEVSMIVRIVVAALFVAIAFAADPVAVGQRPPPRRVQKSQPRYSDPNGGGGPLPTGPNGQVPQNYNGVPNGQVPQNYYAVPNGQVPQNYYGVPNGQVPRNTNQMPQYSDQVPQYYGQGLSYGQLPYYQLVTVCAQQAQQVQDLQGLVDALNARIAELEATIQQLVGRNRTQPPE